ncbi:MAG: hypothetical protein M9905_12150 [Rhizobiaceae bacterium]|nr:hypothetical protein [Rhizobiaceae bacterium]
MDGPEGWDLILGDGRHWSDPLDPERRATWRDHRDAIITRWVKPFRPGWRPAAWFDFDLPELAKRASPWRAEALERWASDPEEHIPTSEFVHALRSTTDEERAGIEAKWRKVLASGMPGCARLQVPRWFAAQG